MTADTINVGVVAFELSQKIARERYVFLRLYGVRSLRDGVTMMRVG